MPTFKSSDRSSRLDWVIRRAQDVELLLTFTSGGSAYDTTNATITAEIKRGTTVVLTPTIVNGGVTGLVNLQLTNTQTDITGDQYFWSIKIQNPAGFDMMMINGIFHINEFLWDSENINQDSTVQITI
jgi:hypothetical protein